MASKKTTALPVVGILGTSGHIARVLPPVGSALEQAGFNTGNLLYQYAAAQLIPAPALSFPIGNPQRLAQIRASIDVLHIPAANQLNPEYDLQDWADLVEYLGKPVLVAGLGIQSALEQPDIELQPGTVNFIKALAKWAPAIGVRGALTRQLLQRHGVDNVVITGCPSNFLNRSVSGRAIAGLLARAAARHTLRCDYFPGTMSHFRDVERQLRQLVQPHDYRYVLQTNEHLFRYLDGSEDDGVHEYLDWEHSQLAPESDGEQYRRIYRERGRYYLSAPSWLDAASRIDLGIGMRMHGAIATIQGGAAGVCVVADARMQELVNTMGYPQLQIADVLGAPSLHALLGAVQFDPEAFDDKRAQLYQNYAALVTALKLPLRD